MAGEEEFTAVRTRMKLSVIVPVYNEVIDRINALEMPGFEKEIIVADGGSRDESALSLIITAKNIPT